MACEWEVYESRLNQLGYAEYDNETLISARVHNFAGLKTLNTVVALVEIGRKRSSQKLVATYFHQAHNIIKFIMLCSKRQSEILTFAHADSNK